MSSSSMTFNTLCTRAARVSLLTGARSIRLASIHRRSSAALHSRTLLLLILVVSRFQNSWSRYKWRAFACTSTRWSWSSNSAILSFSCSISDIYQLLNLTFGYYCSLGNEFFDIRQGRGE